MKSYRTTDGRFMSRKQHDRNQLRSFRNFILMLVLATALGVITHFVRSEETQASNMMTDEELCSLHVVECDDWAPLEIYEIGHASPNVTPGEVALWYIESNNVLLDIVINSGDIDALDALLKEQHAYARAVMIVTAQ